jgi:hypothetical protein
MTLPVPVTHPAWDARFRTLVRGAVDAAEWRLTAPEGIAFLEALLRARYPYAVVVARAQTALDALHDLDPLIVAYRDGVPTAERAT